MPRPRKSSSSVLQKSGFVLFTFGTLCLGALLHAACKDGKSHASSAKGGDSEETLAKIDDVVITVGEFRERINKQSPYVRARYTSLERKKEFLDNLVRFEVLAKEADKRGLGEDPEVVRTMKQVMIQKLMQDEFDKVKIEDITDAEMKTFYDSHNGASTTSRRRCASARWSSSATPSWRPVSPTRSGAQGPGQQGLPRHGHAVLGGRGLQGARRRSALLRRGHARRSPRTRSEASFKLERSATWPAR